MRCVCRRAGGAICCRPLCRADVVVRGDCAAAGRVAPEKRHSVLTLELLELKGRNEGVRGSHSVRDVLLRWRDGKLFELSKFLSGFEDVH